MSRWHGITPTQCRAARAGLSLKRSDVATATEVSEETIGRLEHGIPIGRTTCARLIAFFEARGVSFLHDVGPPGPHRTGCAVAFSAKI